MEFSKLHHVFISLRCLKPPSVGPEPNIKVSSSVLKRFVTKWKIILLGSTSTPWIACQSIVEILNAPLYSEGVLLVSLRVTAP